MMGGGDDRRGEVGEADGAEQAREPIEVSPTPMGEERLPYGPEAAAPVVGRLLAPPRDVVRVGLGEPVHVLPESPAAAGSGPPPAGSGLPPAGSGPPGEPGLGALLRLGLRGAIRVPWVVVGLAAARLLRMAAGWTPAILVLAVVIRSLVEGGPDASLLEPTLLLPLMGVYVAGSLAGWMVELAIWSGGARLLDEAIGAGAVPGTSPRLLRGIFSSALADSFPRFTRLALIFVIWRLAWGGATLALLIGAGTLYGTAFSTGAGGFWAASALALIGAFFLVATPLADWIGEASIARVGARGDGALHGIFEGARLLGRRPFPVIGSLLLLGFLGAVAEKTMAGPLGLLTPSASTVLFWMSWQLPMAFAAAFVAVWRMGALVAATRTSAP